VVQENLVGKKLNLTHHLLVCVDDVNLLGNNTNIKNKNTQALSETMKEVGLEVNTKTIKHLFIARLQNVG
jgi:hypothetical protein